MDSLITDTALAVLVAAKGGLLKPVTDGVSQLVKTTGAKLWTLVTARFAKDGPGATQAMTSYRRRGLFIVVLVFDELSLVLLFILQLL